MPHSLAPQLVQKFRSALSLAPQMGQTFSEGSTAAAVSGAGAVAAAGYSIGLPQEVQKRTPFFTIAPQLLHLMVSSDTGACSLGSWAPQALQKATPA